MKAFYKFKFINSTLVNILTLLHVLFYDNLASNLQLTLAASLQLKTIKCERVCPVLYEVPKAILNKLVSLILMTLFADETKIFLVIREEYNTKYKLLLAQQ